jgi:hypothetical protein
MIEQCVENQTYLFNIKRTKREAMAFKINY